MLEIEVANRWPNRIIGDQSAPDAGVRTLRWSNGMLGGAEYKAGRYTFTVWQFYNAENSGLLLSGLLGPVAIME